jgi:type II secretory pathway pseudopilin PulG
MTTVLVVLGVVGLVLGAFVWFVHGATRSRIDEARKELEAIENAYEQNAEADNDIDGDIDNIVRDKFGDR